MSGRARTLHPTPRRLLVGMALLILGLTTLATGAFLLDWHRDAGSTRAIADRGAWEAMMFLPWSGPASALVTGAFAGVVAWRRGQRVSQVMGGLVIAFMAMVILTLVTAGTLIFVPGLLLDALHGTAGLFIAGSMQAAAGVWLIVRPRRPRAVAVFS